MSRVAALAGLLVLISTSWSSGQGILPAGKGLTFLPKNLQPGEKVMLVVMLHGMGSSPDQMAPLVQPLVEAWHCAVLVPCGAGCLGLRPDGKPGYNWDPGKDVESLHHGITKLIAEGVVDARRVYLMGFSAGASMAYITGIRHPELFAGVIAFSGALPKEFCTEQSLAAAALLVPIYIVHGTKDEVMPVELGREARDVLGKSGFRVQLQEFPGVHNLPDKHFDIMKDAIVWCQWQRLTLPGGNATQGAAQLKKELPADYSIQIADRFIVGSNCDPQTVAWPMKNLTETQTKCLATFGKKMGESPRTVILVYYPKTYAEYTALFEKIIGVKPGSQYGCCTLSPPRLFGSAECGDGTLTHELVHILLREDWDSPPPGWLDEALAVTLGCPLVRMSNDVYECSDVHRLTALKAIAEGKWTPLPQVLAHGESDYATLNQDKVTLWPGAVVNVGPLTTGAMFIRWLEETGTLTTFYRACRASKDIEAAVKAACSKSSAAMDKDLREWVKSREEGSLLKKKQP